MHDIEVTHSYKAMGSTRVSERGDTVDTTATDWTVQTGAVKAKTNGWYKKGLCMNVQAKAFRSQCNTL
jgi:hypothetical protein